MSTKDGKVLSDMPIGESADAVKLDNGQAFASTAGAQLFVAGETSPGKFGIVQTVKTGDGARTMALDPTTHRIYLPAAEFETGANGRRAPKPGTFTILVVSVSIPHALSQSNPRPTIANEEDFRRAMKELSNWGRWGDDDELGAANLITPAKRKQAVALAKEGVTVSLAHDVVQEHAADAPNILERTLNPVLPTGTSDRYQYTGTYHGIVHSHLDSLDCHMMVDGKGYNG